MNKSRLPILTSLVSSLLILSISVGDSCGQDALEKKRFGRFLTVTSPIDDSVVSQVTNLALKLQSQAERENRDAYLLLEIEPGSSRIGQVSDLVRMLTSAEVSKVRTIAWLPRSIDGTHAILALACHTRYGLNDNSRDTPAFALWCPNPTLPDSTFRIRLLRPTPIVQSQLPSFGRHAGAHWRP